MFNGEFATLSLFFGRKRLARKTPVLLVNAWRYEGSGRPTDNGYGIFIRQYFQQLNRAVGKKVWNMNRPLLIAQHIPFKDVQIGAIFLSI